MLRGTLQDAPDIALQSHDHISIRNKWPWPSHKVRFVTGKSPVITSVVARIGALWQSKTRETTCVTRTNFH